MSWKRLHVSPTMGVAVVALVVAASGGAYAASRAATGTITACVHHKSGGLYIARSCARHDRRLKWGVRGPQGAPGPAGPPGPDTGTAGGDLTGRYPDPQVAAGAIGPSKIASLPGASVHGTVQQTLPANGNSTQIDLSSADYDTDNMFDPAQPNQLVVHTPGVYFLEAHLLVIFAPHSNASIHAEIDRNGSQMLQTILPTDDNGGIALTVTVSGVLRLAAGDTLTLLADQSTGTAASSTTTVNGKAYYLNPRLEAQWLGP